MIACRYAALQGACASNREGRCRLYRGQLRRASDVQCAAKVSGELDGQTTVGMDARWRGGAGCIHVASDVHTSSKRRPACHGEGSGRRNAAGSGGPNVARPTGDDVASAARADIARHGREARIPSDGSRAARVAGHAKVGVHDSILAERRVFSKRCNTSDAQCARRLQGVDGCRACHI